MSIGKVARKVLGPTFPILGRSYRRFFVNLDKVVESLPLSNESCILDVGAGDGELENRILTKYPNASITMLDLDPTVGGWLKPEFRGAVKIFKGDLAAYAS